MAEYSEVFVAFDVAKRKHAVAIAEGGRTGEVRFLGEIENSAATIERVIKRLAGRYDRLHVCFEAGPTGYELYRHIRDLGHDCMVVAPALIPKRPGEHVKTNRRDAITLARLHRAGELTAVWVPDAVHEAVRDLVRAREAAADDLRRKRQQLLSFLLRRGRIYSGGGHWTLAHRRWLAKQAFDIRLNKSSSRRASTQSRMRFSDCIAWNSSWPLSCRAGPWHLPSRPIRRCAVPPSWSL
jgi:transposase